MKLGFQQLNKNRLKVRSRTQRATKVPEVKTSVKLKKNKTLSTTSLYFLNEHFEEIKVST